MRRSAGFLEDEASTKTISKGKRKERKQDKQEKKQEKNENIPAIIEE